MAPALRALCAFLLAAPSPLLAAERVVPSDVKYARIGTHDVARLNKMLTTELAELSDFPVEHAPGKNAVTLYRVTYPAVVPKQDSRPTVASGFIAVPAEAGDDDRGGSAPRPVVSCQQGTVFSKTEVPSRPDESMETQLGVGGR